jgi:putative hemolysin
MQIEIIILFFCLAFSAFFSASEVAFFSISDLHLKKILREKKFNAHLLERLKKNSERFIITVLVGNNITNILATAVATQVFLTKFGDNGIIVATAFMTILVLVFGEIVPKAYAAKRAEKLILLAAPVYIFLSFVLFPVIFLLEKFTIFFLRLMGASKSDHKSHVDEEIVKELVKLGEQDGSINKRESELITNVFEFDDTLVSEIMTPKEQVTTVTTKHTISETLKIMVKTGYSRLPVVDANDVNQAVGTVHLKQLLEEFFAHKNNASKSIQKIVIDAYYIPSTKKIPQLFKGFQNRKVHLALVVNEYGSFEGIVTLEDVLEELVGEVYDETDTHVKKITKLKPGVYAVLANCYIDEFNREFHTSFPEEEDFDTIGGFILSKTGNIHRKGEKIRIENYEFEVIKAARNRILELKVRKVKSVINANP